MGGLHDHSETVRLTGSNGLPDLNPSIDLVLDFRAHLSLSITNTMFEHKYTWHQDTLGFNCIIRSLPMSLTHK